MPSIHEEVSHSFPLEYRFIVRAVVADEVQRAEGFSQLKGMTLHREHLLEFGWRKPIEDARICHVLAIHLRGFFRRTASDPEIDFSGDAKHDIL